QVVYAFSEGRHWLGSRGPGSGENGLAVGQDVVQRVSKETSGLGELPPNLIDVFLPALPDLFLEQQLERAIAQTIAPLGGMVHHDVTHQRAREATGSSRRILREKRIDGGCPAPHGGLRRRGRRSGRSGRRGRRR